MFGYDVARLPNAHLAELERSVTNIEEAQQRTGYTIGYPGWGVIYHALLAHLDRNREEILIETGTNQGCTTIILAQALVDAGCAGRVLTFELDEANLAKARANIEAAGLSSKVEFIAGNTRETLPKALGGVKDVRFAFLDASHLHDDVMSEFRAVEPKLTPDALVLFDNTYAIAEAHEDQRVNGALKSIVSKFGGNLINLEYTSWYTPGLALWQRQPKL
jgi:predicted O-methyltransferase YrrM